MSTKELYNVQNDTENKCGVIRTSHPHQSIENSQRFVSNDPRDCYCCTPPLDATSFENGYLHNRGHFWCVPWLEKKASVTGVPNALCTQFYVEPPS